MTLVLKQVVCMCVVFMETRHVLLTGCDSQVVTHNL